MKYILASMAAAGLLLSAVSVSQAPSSAAQPTVLVFSKTGGYRHDSIESGIEAIKALGAKNGFKVEASADSNAFTEANLKRYAAVIFVSTTGDILDASQKMDFQRFIQAGGGYVGIHAASDTEYKWPWYGQLVGGYFAGHGAIQEATVVKGAAFGKVQVPDPWKRRDEWYNFRDLADGRTVIFSLDTNTFQGSAHPGNHPIAWYREFDGGRSFYTGMGHTKESFSEPLFLDHMLDGIRYAIGKGKLDYKKARTQRPPDEARFTKTVLASNLYEPIELAFLPNKDIVFIERRGDVKYFNVATGKLSVAGTVNVWTREDSEHGLVGMTADPGFARNNWLYFYHSHPDKSANVLTRIALKNGKLDLASAKEMLEVRDDRDACCHTGGSLAFGPGGNLFIGTGDNTTPFESDGFSPSDDLAGR
jgi:cytochrome c